MASQINEQVVLFGADFEAGPDQLTEDLKGTGGRVLQRFGPRVIIVEVPRGTEHAVRQRLRGGTMAVTPAELPEPPTVALDIVGKLGLAAFELRQSARYAEAKRSRPFEGRRWDTDDALIPAGDPMADVEGGEPSSVVAAAAPTPTRDRLVGKVAVGRRHVQAG